MAFELNSIITIGRYKFRGVHEVKINKSLYSPIERCSITIPATSRLKIAGKLVTESVEEYKTKNRFKRGDKVIVQLGYNGKYNTEFEGYVHRINEGTPCVVECEGYVFELNNYLQPKHFVKADFKDILRYIIAGTNIVLAPEMANVTYTIDNFIIQNDVARVRLEKMIRENKLNIFMRGNVLYAGLSYQFFFNTGKYKIGWNTIKDNELKLHTVDDTVQQTILYGGGRKKAEQVKVSVGSNTTNIKRIRVADVTDTRLLNHIGELAQAQASYNGYEGKISALGVPVIQAGDKAVIDDPRYPERSGSYLVEAVELVYNTRGFRRYPSIAFKL